MPIFKDVICARVVTHREHLKWLAIENIDDVKTRMRALHFGWRELSSRVHKIPNAL